jgi:hypothetical protein
VRAFVEAIGIAGPGLRGWEASRTVLSGSVPYRFEPTEVGATLLPPAEQRRAGSSVKLALAVGQQAFAGCAHDAASTPTVFTTSCGDGETLHRICEALATEEREVSPTRFHNSVHNAAAGYWGIATGSMEPSSSLCGHDASFAVGLLEAMAQVACAGKAVALIAYDHPYPEPIHAVRPIEASFGVALILAPTASTKSLAALDADLLSSAALSTQMEGAGLERIRVGVPAARSLPLLAAIARGAAGTISIEMPSGSQLALGIQPCT